MSARRVRVQTTPDHSTVESSWGPTALVGSREIPASGTCAPKRALARSYPLLYTSVLKCFSPESAIGVTTFAPGPNLFAT